MFICTYTYYTVPTGKPKNFSSIPNITFITVEWSAPDLWRRNGIIFHYIIEWGEIGSLTTLNYSVPNPTFNTTDDQRYTFSGLEPITEYTFNIAAVNINGTGPVLNGMSTTLEEGMQFVVFNFFCHIHLYSKSYFTHMYVHIYIHVTYIRM